jgi:hypothetical protein
MNSTIARRLHVAAWIGNGVIDTLSSDYTVAAAWCIDCGQPELAERLQAVAHKIAEADVLLRALVPELRVVDHVIDNGGGQQRLAELLNQRLESEPQP